MTSSGWSGGQYSVYRAIFGAYLFVHFAELLPWSAELFSNAGVLSDGTVSPLLRLFPNMFILCDAPWLVVALFVVTLLLCAAFAIGWRDRWAAVGLWYIWACLHGRMPLIANPGMPYIGWLLLAHAFLPMAPYGSWDARGRTDPAGGWRMNNGIWRVAWLLMALGYTYSGVTKLASPSWADGSALVRVLENPLARPGWPRDLLLLMPKSVLAGLTWAALALEISFAPLALVRRFRPRLWLAMLLMHLQLMLVVDFADLSFGMVILHLFTFSPAWIKPLNPDATETLYYDGACGLCHRSVRFVLAEDTAGTRFRFAPLDSEAFRADVSEAERRNLPDSIVLRTADGRLLTRSSGVILILCRLGGLWCIIGGICRCIPARLRDAMYDGLARVRKRLFAAPTSACPLLPPELRQRFVF